MGDISVEILKVWVGAQFLFPSLPSRKYLKINIYLDEFVTISIKHLALGE